MEKATLSATKRNDLKKNKVKKSRSDGHIPGIIYGLEKEPVPVNVNPIDFEKALRTPFGKNTLLKLTITDPSDQAVDEYVITYDMQRNAVTRMFEHLDFLRVDKKKPVTITVPFKFEGLAPGTKMGGVLIKKLRGAKLSVLPENIPSHITIDLSALQVGDFISVRSLESKDYTILSNENDTIVRIAAPRKTIENAQAADEAESGKTTATTEPAS